MEDDEWIQLTPTTEIPAHAEWKMCTFRRATPRDERTGGVRDEEQTFIARISMAASGEYPLADAPAILQEWACCTPDDGPVMWLFYGDAHTVGAPFGFTQYLFRPLCMNDYVMK